MTRRIVVAGSSGMIGTALTQAARADGDEVVCLVRRPPRTAHEVYWDPRDPPSPDVLDGVDAVVNLAGANIGGRRWTSHYRQVILRSRTTTTRALATLAARAATPPATFLSASGISYYGGDRGEEILCEATPSVGADFLTMVARAWEAATAPATEAGIPVCHLRFGLVLSRSGGVLERMVPYFRAGMGAQISSGRQFWSYVSLVDAVRAVRFLAADPTRTGPYNITAPQPVRSVEFTSTLAQLLHRPHLFRVPAWALRLAMGGVSQDAVGSLCVVPDRLRAAGFIHAHPHIRAALHSAVWTERRQYSTIWRSSRS